MKTKSIISVIIACILTLSTTMPVFASSNLVVDQELSKTGTIYETVSFTTSSSSKMDPKREFEVMQSEVPEFKEIEIAQEGLRRCAQIAEHHRKTCLRKRQLLYRCLAGSRARSARGRVFPRIPGRGRHLVGADPARQDLGLQRLPRGEPEQDEHPSVADLEIRAGQELESHADRGLVLIHI